MPDEISLRSAVARLATKTRCYYPAQWLCGRLGGGFILAFHDQPAECFERQVEALRPNEPVHLSEMVERARAGRRTAGVFAITVDDGVADTVRGIGAVCKRRLWPVTFYVPTDYLDDGRGLPFQLWHRVAARLPRGVLSLASRTLDLGTPETFGRFALDLQRTMHTQPRDRYQPLIEELATWLLDHGLASREQLQTPEPIPWKEVAELSRHETIRFESHGLTHTAVVALPAAALRTELETSRRRVGDHTNRDCRHFCYPFGGPASIGAAAPEIVAKVFETAVTMTRGRLNRRPWSLAPRIPIYERDEPAMTRLKILAV